MRKVLFEFYKVTSSLRYECFIGFCFTFRHNYDYRFHLRDRLQNVETHVYVLVYITLLRSRFCEHDVTSRSVLLHAFYHI